MLRKMRALLLVCSVAGLAACGGTDSAESVMPMFAGNYGVSGLNLAYHNCISSPSSSLSNLSVTQQDTAVFATIVGNGVRFIGSVDTDKGGFTATSSETYVDTDPFTGVSSYTTIRTIIGFRTISAGSTYAVTQTSSLNLPSESCTAVFHGSGTKK
jgi:TctA family transporter